MLVRVKRSRRLQVISIQIRSLFISVQRAFYRIPFALRSFMLAAAVFGAGILGYQLYQQSLYSLDGKERQLLGEVSIDTRLLKETEQAFSYNAADDKKTKSSVVLAAAADSTGEVPYRATLPKQPGDGIKFGSTEDENQFTMTPLFDTSEGQAEEGRVLYSKGSNELHAYTFKRNGIKQDIIIRQAITDELSYSWKLNLGDQLEARMLPDGGVGIYGADDMLGGDVQASSDADQALLDKARKNAAKTKLLYALPPPYIVDSAGKTDEKNVSFKLVGETLTLRAKDLKDMNYPLTIDPTIVVPTNTSFRTATDDGMINYSVSTQISRSAISLGTIATDASAGSITNARNSPGSVVYNGFLYVVGGNNTSTATYYDDIQYCPINGGGIIGACVQQTAAFLSARTAHTTAVYNGYLYIIAGADASVFYDDIIYCPIHASGYLGNGGNGTANTQCIQQDNKVTSARQHLRAAVSGGYLYLVGGNTVLGGGYQNNIQRCPFEADGAVGTCINQGNMFTTARSQAATVIYNGWMYIVGGTNGTAQDDIHYCPINSDASVGTCIRQTGAFTTARFGHSVVAYNGYLYIAGGSNGTNQSDIQYCALYPNGTFGTCAVDSTGFTTARSFHSTAVYDGYIYIVAGSDGTSRSDIRSVAINTGTPTGFGAVGTTTQQLSAFTTARQGHASVVYNGFIYIIGGIAGTNQNDIQFSTMNTNGSLSCPSAFTCPTGVYARQTTAFTNIRSNHSSVVYKGYLYIIGGAGSSSLNDIIRCPIHANGSIGNGTGGNGTANTLCVQQTTAFTGARETHTSEVYNGYLYITGGRTSGGGQNDIIRCPIHANGSIGNGTGGNGTANTLCVQQTAAFTNPRNGMTAAAYNGYLYIVGGRDDNLFFLSDILYCPLDAAGIVGTCTTNPTGFTTGRTDHASVVANGYIYVMGGTNGTLRNDIQYLPARAPDLSARYEKLINLGAFAGSIDSLVYNGLAMCGARITYATAPTSGVFTAATTLPNTMPGATISLGTSGGRYVRLLIELDDSTCGGTSNITDITISYTLSAQVPVLITPAANAANISLLPQFTLRAPDDEGDNLQYMFQVCSAADCSTVIRTICQTNTGSNFPAGVTCSSPSQTGWAGQDQAGTAYTGNADVSSSTTAIHNYQASALSAGTTYWWRGYAIDPAGSNTWSVSAPIQSFTTSVVPSAPTLVEPVSAGASQLPQFQLRSTDQDGDYLQYRIELCSDASCATVLRTIDQSSSQSGWLGQDAGNGTAYNGAPILSSSALARHNLQSPALNPTTTYYWQAQAKDPAGSDTWSAVSSIGTFNTGSGEIRILGGTNFRGGVEFGN